MIYDRIVAKAKRAYRRLVDRASVAHPHGEPLPETGLDDSFYQGIPIFINNRDLVVWPKMLVDKLSSLGFHNVVILDNDSSYPPLHAFYESTGAKVVKLGKNYGLRALFDCGILQQPEYKNKMYVYTDPDCIPADFCPEDFLRRFHQILLRHQDAPKVGFSLCAWDWAYYWWEVENGYFANRVSDYAYRTPIDTTFALYRAGTEAYCVGGYRTTRPYLCRHMPWEYRYLPLGESPEDFIYYLLLADPQSSVTRMAQQDEAFLQHPRVRAVKAKYSLDM